MHLSGKNHNTRLDIIKGVISQYQTMMQEVHAGLKTVIQVKTGNLCTQDSEGEVNSWSMALEGTS